MRDGGDDDDDDALGAKGCITAKENLRQHGLKRVLAQHRQAPAVKLDTVVVLDPRERIFLPHRHQHFVADTTQTQTKAPAALASLPL